MAYKNYWRVVISNEYIGKSRELSAPNEMELNLKIERQRQIWEEEAKRKMRMETKENLKSEAERLTKRDQAKILKYINIVNDYNKMTIRKHFSKLVNNDSFPEFEYQELKPTIEEAYIKLDVPKKTILELIFKSKKEVRIEKERLAKELYDNELKKYDIEKDKVYKSYLEEKAQVEEIKRKYNDKLLDREKNLREGSIQEFEKYILEVLNSSNYPEEIEKNIEIEYIENRKTLIISFQLPTSNKIPSIIEHKFVNSRSEIDEIEMKKKEFEEFYNNIIYMMCLRSIKEVLEADEIKLIENVVFNGWINYTDKSTGNDAQSCILSLEVSREQFYGINIEKIDYKECIKGFKGLFAPSFVSIIPVVPILNINREDKRFIESKEVSEIGIDGYNLATMPWEDFEYFVRELFNKMFSGNGGEVKVTQASRDGGVDAIAFDDDPIRGGKFVIQAKRYNNVVPVSAVRDLYGTMIHEGATKGILVTTSFYGKDSYDFSKDKPLTLIDGQSLLGLLNKYGYSNLKIKLKEN